MEVSTGKSKLLPENAYTPLKEGEVYKPVVPPDQSPPETTVRAVVMGCIGVAVFTFAAAYIGLKAGNVIETAIPIAILAIFFGKMFARKNHLLENVIVQSIGAAAGVVVAGAVFTIPAMYILELDVSFVDIFLGCCIGGFLGVLLIIPLRRYFCRDEHGKLPFPEATATTEILCSGESGSGGGKTLLTAFGLGFLFDFCIEIFRLWEGRLETAKHLLGSVGQQVNEKYRMVLEMEATAALFGLGYIIGIRYAAIICAGSVLANLVLVPMVFFVGGNDLNSILPPGEETIKNWEAADIFKWYVRPIGIGAIAMAGMISILKMGKIIVGSLSLGFKGILGGSKDDTSATPRTDLDINPRNVMLLELLFVALMFLIFFYVANWQLNVALVGTLVTAALAFLFTPVAARAIAIVGVNPVSGMTMITLIIACTILVASGLSGDEGKITVLIIGCAVCTALSTSGAFISDLKIGYWLGATPRRQQRWKFLGIVVASLCVGLVIHVLATGYGFVESPDHPNPLPAPQGNLMATIVDAIFGGAESPWLLYAMGAAIALMLEMVALPGLAFALGIYLPIYINLPVLVGGFAAWVLSKRGRTDREKSARKNQGILVASGLVAGAAIAGVVAAVLKTLDQKDLKLGFIDTSGFKGAINNALNFSHNCVQNAEGVYEESGAKDWFENNGMLIGLIMIIVLAVICHFVAAAAARKQIEDEDTAGDE